MLRGQQESPSLLSAFYDDYNEVDYGSNTIGKNHDGLDNNSRKVFLAKRIAVRMTSIIAFRTRLSLSEVNCLTWKPL